ncbi:DUF6923 family protein [Saccharopolyspora phatthalungensis]|nr:hypothetical protein [Saccharopolyspora phatthalungensis]
MAVLAASVAWVSAGAAPGCTVLQVRSTVPGANSTLYRVMLPTAESTRLGQLDYRVNALGYAASQGLVYAMAERGRFGLYTEGIHVVTLGRSGEVRDLGPVRADQRGTPWHPANTATAGAIKGNRWYVQDGNQLYAVDVDPASRTYLSVLSRTAVQSSHWPFALDDFDVDPVDGELYGVSMTFSAAAAIVRIDPDSGRVTKLVDAPGLPPSTYGSVVIGSDRALYVTANEVGGLYRVERDGSVTKLAGVLPMSSSDAAGCLTQAAPMPRPPTPRPPTPRPPAPELPTTPMLAATPPPAPPVQSPVPSATPSTPAPSTPEPRSIRTPPVPPPEPGAYAPPTQEAGIEHSGHDTKEKRRWALATVLLLIGGSAAVRRLGR